MAIPSLSALLLAAVNGFAALVTFGMDNPRGEYYDHIPSVKENRLADVHNELAPIVSDVHDFLEEGEDGSVEELSEEDQAALALAGSVTPAEDLPGLREALNNYHYPEKVYRRCRLSRDGCYVSFVGGLVFALGPAFLDISRFTFADVAPLPMILFGFAIFGLAAGIVSFGSFLYYRRKLDDMTENADFKLD